MDPSKMGKMGKGMDPSKMGKMGKGMDPSKMGKMGKGMDPNKMGKMDPSKMGKMKPGAAWGADAWGADPNAWWESPTPSPTKKGKSAGVGGPVFGGLSVPKQRAKPQGESNFLDDKPKKLTKKEKKQEKKEKKEAAREEEKAKKKIKKEKRKEKEKKRAEKEAAEPGFFASIFNFFGGEDEEEKTKEDIEPVEVEETALEEEEEEGDDDFRDNQVMTQPEPNMGQRRDLFQIDDWEEQDPGQWNDFRYLDTYFTGLDQQHAINLRNWIVELQNSYVPVHKFIREPSCIIIDINYIRIDAYPLYHQVFTSAPFKSDFYWEVPALTEGDDGQQSPGDGRITPGKAEKIVTKAATKDKKGDTTNLQNTVTQSGTLNKKGDAANAQKDGKTTKTLGLPGRKVGTKNTISKSAQDSIKISPD